MSVHALALALVSVTLAAAEPGTLMDSLQACLRVEDAAQRLACFDSVAKSGEPAAQAPAAQAATAQTPAAQPPASPAASNAPVQPTQPTQAAQANAPNTASTPSGNSYADFGREQRVAVKRGGDRMTSTLVAVTQTGYGQLRVTLANGQIWEQVGNERFTLAVGDHVVIERGALHSFFLSKASANRKVHFRRID